MIRVFLLDDHEAVRDGLRALLEATGEMTVVGEAASVAEGLERIPESDANVAILDVRLPDGRGTDVCKHVRATRPDIACLILTSFSDDEALESAVTAGAAGYVLKQINAGQLIESVTKVAAGESLLDPEVVAKVRERLDGGSSTG